jgi:hypothetical protein
MTEPTVCAIMLTRDRPEMAARAIASFRAQTYKHKRLLIVDTGRPALTGHAASNWDDERGQQRAWHYWSPENAAWTIGQLRNAGNWRGGNAFGADILAHWDDDDWSHPNRLAEQIAMLQSSGADVVGYNQALFWDTSKTAHVQRIAEALGLGGKEDRDEAWLWTCEPTGPSVLGASLCYWRKTWERKPFKDTSRGEDLHFVSGLKSGVASSLGIPGSICADANVPSRQPRLICGVHGGNTCTRISPGGRCWKRAEQWDLYCLRRMTRIDGSMTVMSEGIGE